jgi:hydroxymethylbilane synthase
VGPHCVAAIAVETESFPSGGLVGTGSVRRRAQLAAARPDVSFGPLRGNIETRLRKQRDEGFDAVVVALAALERLGLSDQVAEALDPSVMLPQVAQGALAVECRTDDGRTRDLLARIDDARHHVAVRTERAFLAQLGGGCNLPVGALASVGGDGEIVLYALLARLDGHIVLRTRVAGREPEDVGRTTAADLLDAKGGRGLLEDENVFTGDTA